MEKRTLLAIVLSLLVLVIFSYLTPQKPSKEPVVVPAEKVKPEQEKAPEPAEQVKIATPAPAPTTVSKEREIRVENNVFSAVFTTRGGTIKQWKLKEYPDNDVLIELVPPGLVIPPVTIIPAGQLGVSPPVRNFIADTEADSITFGAAEKKNLSFFFSDPSGLTIKKTYTFYKNSYHADITTDVGGVESYYVVLGSDFGVFDEKGTWVHIGPVLFKDNNKIDIDTKNIEGIGFIKRMTGTESRDEVLYQGAVKWIAQEDKYFTSALIATEGQYDARVWKRKFNGGGKDHNVEIAYKVEQPRGNFLLYAGPKQIEVLTALDAGLEHIIDFGFFSIIARPLFWLLKYIYKVIGNYGWAIVLLTLIVRIPFIPLLNKSQRSMKKLQEIQPHMTAVKEKYKKDPQKAQKEMMTLYKKHKVNPMGGCLPMLIQLPVFLALYKILLIAIELKGAPFILWITDLSLKDPYYIFPVTMGATMVIQQKMTPTSMDPKQAKIMMLMPIVFTFMFLSFPVGLVLYWLVNNVLGIAQQFYTNKKSKQSA